MKLAAAIIIAGTLLSIGFCMETSRKETAKQLQELIRFLLFAGQEIEIRGSILEDVFTKASSITQGATKELVSRMAKRMAEGGDFLQEWSHAVNEVSYAACLAFARQLFFLFCYGKRGIPEWMSI